MTFHVPAWVRSDPGAPPRLPSGPGGQVVAMVAADGAMADGWAAEVAVDLARGWSDRGVRVVLADGGLESPTLPAALGGEGGEGLADALLWGASMRRVARRAEGSGFFTISAGTPVADGPAVLASPRWAAMCAGFREAGVTLAVLVPARDACLTAVLEQASGVVVLANSEETVPLALRLGKSALLAVVGREALPERERHVASVTPDQEPSQAPVDVSVSDSAPDSLQPGLASGKEELRPRLPDFTLTDAAAPVGEEEPEAEPEPVLAVPTMPEPGARPGPELEAEPETEPQPEADLALLVDTLQEPTPETEATLTPADAPAEDVADAPPQVRPADEPQAEDVRGEVFPAAGWNEGEAASASYPGHEPSEPVLPSHTELPEGPVPTFEEIVEESEQATASRGSASRRNLAGLSVLVLAVAGAVAAALLGYLRIPGISPAGEPAEGPRDPSTTPATVAAPPAVETSEAAPFSVGLAAFQDPAAAAAMVRELSGKVKGVLFSTAPASVDGQILYRVLAGPAADSAAAVALGARVAEAGGLGTGDWVARRTPRAFALGEMPDAEAALRRSEVLQGLGVPAYVLAVTYSDGSVRFRVYAGAYADDAEATYLSGLLQERGLSGATLSERTGRLPE